MENKNSDTDADTAVKKHELEISAYIFSDIFEENERAF